MEKLIVLGTGNAGVKKCYNTCFVLKNKNEYLLVDAGGGNGILRQLDLAKIDLTEIENYNYLIKPQFLHVFSSHKVAYSKADK